MVSVFSQELEPLYDLDLVKIRQIYLQQKEFKERRKQLSERHRNRLMQFKIRPAEDAVVEGFAFWNDGDEDPKDTTESTNKGGSVSDNGTVTGLPSPSTSSDSESSGGRSTNPRASNFVRRSVSLGSTADLGTGDSSEGGVQTVESNLVEMERAKRCALSKNHMLFPRQERKARKRLKNMRRRQQQQRSRGGVKAAAPNGGGGTHEGPPDELLLAAGRGRGPRGRVSGLTTPAPHALGLVGGWAGETHQDMSGYVSGGCMGVDYPTGRRPGSSPSTSIRSTQSQVSVASSVASDGSPVSTPRRFTPLVEAPADTDGEEGRGGGGSCNSASTSDKEEKEEKEREKEERGVVGTPPPKLSRNALKKLQKLAVKQQKQKQRGKKGKKGAGGGNKGGVKGGVGSVATVAAAAAAAAVSGSESGESSSSTNSSTRRGAAQRTRKRQDARALLLEQELQQELKQEAARARVVTCPVFAVWPREGGQEQWPALPAISPPPSPAAARRQSTPSTPATPSALACGPASPVGGGTPASERPPVLRRSASLPSTGSGHQRSSPTGRGVGEGQEGEAPLHPSRARKAPLSPAPSSMLPHSVPPLPHARQPHSPHGNGVDAVAPLSFLSLPPHAPLLPPASGTAEAEAAAASGRAPAALIFSSFSNGHAVVVDERGVVRAELCLPSWARPPGVTLCATYLPHAVLPPPHTALNPHGCHSRARTAMVGPCLDGKGAIGVDAFNPQPHPHAHAEPPVLGGAVVSGHASGAVTVWRLSAGGSNSSSHVHTMLGHAAPVRVLAFMQAAKRGTKATAAAGAAGEGGAPAAPCPLPAGPRFVTANAATANATTTATASEGPPSLVASGDASGAVLVWDIESGTRSCTLQPSLPSAVRCLLLLPGRVLAGDASGALYVYSLPNGSLLCGDTSAHTGSKLLMVCVNDCYGCQWVQ